MISYRFVLLVALAPLTMACRPVSPTFVVKPPWSVCPSPYPASERPATGRVIVTLENEMGDNFDIRYIAIGLDSTAICWRFADPGARLDFYALPALTVPLADGPHELQIVTIIYGRNDPRSGVGLSGYRFEVRSMHQFDIASGKTMRISVAAYERWIDSKTGVRRPPEERPAVRYAEHEEVGVSDAPR